MIPYHRTFDAMAGMFGWMFRVAGVPFGFLEGRTFLEIGTGQYMNHPLCALVCGASEATTYDIKDNRKLDSIYEPFNDIVMANRFLSELTTHSDFNDKTKNIRDLVDQVKFTTVFPEEKYDIVFSYSMLEHVNNEDIDNMFLKIRSVSSGITLHYIDLLDPHKSNNIDFIEWANRFSELDWEVKHCASDNGSYTIIKTTL